MFSGFLNNPAWAESCVLKQQFCLKVSVLESWNIRCECRRLRLPIHLTRERHPAAGSVLACLMAGPGSFHSLQRNLQATTLNLKDSIKRLGWNKPRYSAASLLFTHIQRSIFWLRAPEQRIELWQGLLRGEGGQFHANCHLITYLYHLSLFQYWHRILIYWILTS